jgi:hypothetical protein
MKFKVVLPPSQVLISLALWHFGRLQEQAVGGLYDTVYISTANLAFYGINAPVHIPLVLAGRFSSSALIWRIGALTCVFALWFLVGRELDSFGASRPEARGLWWNVSLVCLGGYLLVFSMINFSSLQDLGRYNNGWGNLIEGAFFWLWSVVLLVFPSRGILNKQSHLSL